MQLEEGLDTGAIYDTVRVPIGPTTTADELRHTLVAAGCEQLVRCLAQALPTPVPQMGEPVYAAKIRPEELRIDWSAPAVQTHRLVRLGGAWTTLRDKRVRVVAASHSPSVVHDESLEWPVAGLQLLTVQPEGKGPMPFADFARGARLEAGERFV